jgi:hypothetical protein
MTESWKILEKKIIPDRGGVQLTLICERNGRKREAVVSGATYDVKQVGDMVELSPEFNK